MVWVKGFWQKTCLPFFIAATDTAACRLSVVHTTTASRSLCFSSSSRTSLKTIVGVDDFLTWLAARNTTGHLERMGQLKGLVGAEPIPAAIDAQQFAHGLTKLMRIPLRVIGAGPVGIADGDALHVGFTQKAQHDAQTLRANADKRNIDLVARWNISRAAQHATRYDGQAHRRRSGFP